MADADVTIRYEFLPTERSIRESAERVVKQFNKTAGKQEWGTGIYSKDYFSKMNETMKKANARTKTEFDKTTDSIINFLRATQQKTSLQTKILSGMKFLGLRGGAGGTEAGEEGGGIAAGVGALGGGGVLVALGAIAALLTVISVSMMLISAFFDAVGPIIKVVVKMISAMILILLMPFLKRGLPVLFGILKWMIQMAKGISTFADQFMTYMEKLFGRVLTGDPMAIVELLLGPIGMLGIFLAKKLVEFLAEVDWKGIVDSIIPLLESAFAILGEAINAFGTAVFGEETWGKIKAAIRFIQEILAPEGLWGKIKEAIDYIGKEIFGEAVWNNIKALIGTAKDLLITSLTNVSTAIQEIAIGMVNWWNSMFGWIARVSTPKSVDSKSFLLKALGVSLGGGGGKSVKDLVEAMDAGYSADSGMRGGETIAERDARVGGYIAGGMATDFISRPGMALQSFSPNDTIIGTKTPGAIGGGNITNNLYVSAGVDKSEFRKLLTEFSRQQGRELRTRTGYYGG